MPVSSPRRPRRARSRPPTGSDQRQDGPSGTPFPERSPASRWSPRPRSPTEQPGAVRRRRAPSRLPRDRRHVGARRAASDRPRPEPVARRPKRAAASGALGRAAPRRDHRGSAGLPEVVEVSPRKGLMAPRRRRRQRCGRRWSGDRARSLPVSCLPWRGGRRLRCTCLRRHGSTGTGFIPQISSAYCRIVRSLENFPMPAVLRIDFRVHPA
jgi:hypothetical protein